MTTEHEAVAIAVARLEVRMEQVSQGLVDFRAESKVSASELTASMKALESRERERNGQIREHGTLIRAQDQAHRDLGASFGTFRDEFSSRFEEVEGNVAALMQADVQKKRDAAIRKDERSRWLKGVSLIYDARQDLFYLFVTAVGAWKLLPEVLK